MKTDMMAVTVLALLIAFLMTTVYFGHHPTIWDLLPLLANYTSLGAVWLLYRSFHRHIQGFESTLLPEQQSKFKVMRSTVAILAVLSIANVGFAFRGGLDLRAHF